MIIQEKGQTPATLYAAVRKDSSNGKINVVWRTVSGHLETTKLLTQEYINEFPEMWRSDAMPLAGYAKLEITAEMLPFRGLVVSPLDKP